MHSDRPDLTLYPDFTLTVDNCDLEPIHRPRAIQGHGWMMAFSDRDPNYLLAMSENLPLLLDKHAQQLWTRPVDEWMPTEILVLYREMANPEGWDSVDPIPVQIKGKELNTVRHIHNDIRFLEMEARTGNNTEISTFRAIRAISEPLKNIQELDSLFAKFTSIFKKVMGYDRVMVYRFDADFHGHVVGEAREEHLEPFLGLHYPATDIPKMARDLFLLNRSRIISDIHLGNHWLHFNPGLASRIPHLDLSYSQLRATSPIHIEYLKNMGVGASFTLAIILENKLWGLVACHHYSPYFIPYEMRKTGELIASELAQRLTEIAQRHKQNDKITLQNHAFEFLETIGTSTEINLQLFRKQFDLSHICNAHGYAVISSQIGLYSKGLVPEKEALIEIKSWLHDQNNPKIFHTRDLSATLPAAISIPEHIGGMISISIDPKGELMIFWFRKSQQAIYHWGGDPSQPYEVDHLKNGEIRLSPRKSFEKWKQQVDAQSIPWEEAELEMAAYLREKLLHKIIERQASVASSMERDFEQLVYVTSHDLQEPLRTVSNYISLIAEELGAASEEDLQFYMERTGLAAKRMSTLVKDMLDYSRIGKNKEKEWINTQALLSEILEDLHVSISESQAEITVSSLPNIFGEPTEVKQVFQNLISNAIKYRKADQSPLIHISSTSLGEFWTFSVSDNGIGISEEYFDKIFLMFQRLHSHDEYQGTGIGLAHTQKIINGMGGKIWVDSVPGKGSTFSFSLHTSIIQENG